MIFVDTSHWIAGTLARDRRHAEALEISGAVEGATLITSNLVVGETWTFLRSRTGHRRAVTWLDTTLSRPAIRLERIDEELEREAWAWLRIHDERPYSFVDATSFALMRKLRVTDALAFDGDFAAAGFNELRAA